jgi:PAS domain S-box-containing protein/diguanylate cyclase (GGDEF)-like protein
MAIARRPVAWVGPTPFPQASESLKLSRTAPMRKSRGIITPSMNELRDPNIFRAVLDCLPTGVYLVGSDGKILFWNDGAERITGYLRHDVIGRSCRENILAQCNQQHCGLCGSVCPLTGTTHERKASHALMFFLHKQGHRVPVQVRSVSIRSEKGTLVGIAESFDDQSLPSDRGNREHNLAAHGCLDAITGVMNQALIRSYLREHLAFFTEYDLTFGILSIRIKDFEPFRTSHGREAADDMLHVVAETMKQALGMTGFLGRWREDQFLVIVPNCSANELKHAGDNLESSINSLEMRWWGDVLTVNIVLGRAMVQAGDTQEILLQRAEPLPGSPSLPGPRSVTANSQI